MSKLSKGFGGVTRGFPENDSIGKFPFGWDEGVVPKNITFRPVLQIPPSYYKPAKLPPPPPAHV